MVNLPAKFQLENDFEDNYSIPTRNWVSFLSSGLSIVGALYIFTVFLLFKRIRSKVLYRLVFNISLADFIGILAGMYLEPGVRNSESPTDYCIISAAFLVYGNFSTLFWSVSFAYKIYQLIVREKSLDLLKSLKWSYCCCIGIPALLGFGSLLISYLVDYPLFGYSITYCWVNINSDDKMIQNVLSTIYYIPTGIVLIANIVLYVKIFRILKKLKLKFKWPFLFMLYPVIFGICCLPAIIDRFFIMADTQHDGMALLHYIHVGFSQIHGFFNAIIYGVNPEIKKEVKKFWAKKNKKKDFSKLDECLKEEEEEEETDSPKNSDKEEWIE